MAQIKKLGQELNGQNEIHYLIIDFMTGGTILSTNAHGGEKTLVAHDDKNYTPLMNKIGETIYAKTLNNFKKNKPVVLTYRMTNWEGKEPQPFSEEISSDQTNFKEYDSIAKTLRNNFFLLNPPKYLYFEGDKEKKIASKMMFFGEAAYYIAELMSLEIKKFSSDGITLPYVLIPATKYNNMKIAAISKDIAPIKCDEVNLDPLKNYNETTIKAIQERIKRISDEEAKKKAEAAAEREKAEKKKNK